MTEYGKAGYTYLGREDPLRDCYVDALEEALDLVKSGDPEYVDWSTFRIVEAPFRDRYGWRVLGWRFEAHPRSALHSITLGKDD